MNEFIKIICLVITVYFIHFLIPDGAKNANEAVLVGFALVGFYLVLLGIGYWILSITKTKSNKEAGEE
jgi:inner membrane protein involved in colicin E2 resistance